MADNKVSVELEVIGNAAKKIDEISDSVDGLQKTFKDGFAKAGSSFEVFKGVLEAAAVEKVFEIAAESASKLFELFIVDGVKAAIAQEEAVNKLNQALALSGEYSAEASEDFIAYAESLQDTTTFSNDAILSTGALIESLGNLSEEGLKDATLAAANLASQLGVDLETAARKLGVAAEGNVASLKKFGITVEEGETNAESFANAIEAINEKFGGSAAARTQTYAGSLKQIGNNFDDLVKVSGEAIVKNNVVVAVFGEVNKILQELVKSAEGNKDGLKEMVAQGILGAIDASVALASILDGLYKVGVIAFQSLRAAADVFGLGLITAFGGPIGLIDEFLSKLPGIGDSFGSVSAQIQEAATTVSNDLQTSLGSIAEATAGPSAAFVALESTALRLREKAGEAFAAMKEGAETTVEPINNAKTAVEELTAAQIALGEEGEKIFQRELEKDPSEKYTREIEALEAAIAQELIDREDAEAVKAELQLQADQAEDELVQKRIDRLRNANQILALDNTQANQQQIAANKAKIDAILADENTSNIARLTAQKKLKDDSIRNDNERLNAGKEAFGQLASFQNAKTKELAAVGKAAAIAQTVIQTYQGAQAAFTALAPIPFVGPALGIAAAAAAIAAGIGRVAQISGVELAGGIDEVPGTGFKDNFPAVLAPGERVVPAQTNQDLKAFLSDSEGQRSALNNIADRLDKLQNQVVVNIGGKELINEINDQTRSGRALAI